MTPYNWFTLAGTTQTCLLDGFDGPKTAHAYFPLSPKGSVTIISLDEELSINVNWHIAISKFEQSTHPTFYYS